VGCDGGACVPPGSLFRSSGITQGRNGREEIIYEKREVMYDMRRVEIESMEDMEALPEGKWVGAPAGLHAKFVYSVDRENNKLTIALPEGVAKRIGEEWGV